MPFADDNVCISIRDVAMLPFADDDWVVHEHGPVVPHVYVWMQDSQLCIDSSFFAIQHIPSALLVECVAHHPQETEKSKYFLLLQINTMNS